MECSTNCPRKRTKCERHGIASDVKNIIICQRQNLLEVVSVSKKRI